MKITHDQAIDAVQLVMALADEADRGGDGRAAQMVLGRPVIDRMIAIRDAINAQNKEPKA